MTSTTIKGPFDEIEREDKAILQCSVPEAWAFRWFKQVFPKRGAQDRIMSSLLQSFFDLCEQNGIVDEYNSKNEKIAQKLLNELKEQCHKTTH